MKSYIQKPKEVQREWFLVDVSGKTLGRVATQIASILRGKHKPTYTPHVDCGDYVIVINAELIKLTGKKLEQKRYYWHTGYVGNLKNRTAKEMLQRRPEKVIELAVKGMLPKNSLGRSMFKKLKVYAGSNHEHQAQKPQVKEL